MVVDSNDNVMKVTYLNQSADSTA